MYQWIGSFRGDNGLIKPNRVTAYSNITFRYNTTMSCDHNDLQANKLTRRRPLQAAIIHMQLQNFQRQSPIKPLLFARLGQCAIRLIIVSNTTSSLFFGPVELAKRNFRRGFRPMKEFLHRKPVR
jgi:hypothetical protein